MEPDALLRAVAEPHRRAILRLVRDEPRSVGEVAKQLDDITQQAVSQHLQVLREAGLVTVERQGQRRLYLIRPEGLDTLERFFAELWPRSLQRLKQTIETDVVR
jgi:DNA-binding transcriptional ArsR family regulator